MINLERITIDCSAGEVALLKRSWVFVRQKKLEKQEGVSLEAVNILKELGLDADALAATLIYSNYPKFTEEELTMVNHSKVTKLLVNLRALEKITELVHQFTNPQNYHRNLDNLRKLFLAMVTDIRIVIIKLAIHLTILRKARLMPADERRRLVQETQNIYAPLANRLGIARLKLELEDLAFKYANGHHYQKIAEHLHQYFPNRERYIELIQQQVSDLVRQSTNSSFEITGRAKHIFSIYRKMKRKKVKFKDIYDIIAVRICVATVEDCYAILSAVHAQWGHIPGEFDDYIANAKPNGYRSIHTAIHGPERRVVEIQIRTYEMHRQAELGVAAHWVYKEGQQEETYQLKLNWLRELMEWHRGLSGMDINLSSIFNDFIYLFTPKGDILELPYLATPLDFAYYIHEKVGHHCVGAKVNNLMVPLSSLLHNGDKVEILTNSKGEPKPDWIAPDSEFIRTRRAKSKVLQWFKLRYRVEQQALGETLYHKVLRRLKKQTVKVEDLLQKLKCTDLKTLFLRLGAGHLSCNQLEKVMGEEDKLAKAESKFTTKFLSDSTTRVCAEGLDNLLVIPAKCCQPILGDAILGYITQNRGVALHKQNCRNLVYLRTKYPKKIMSVSWKQGVKDKDYSVKLTINTVVDLQQQLINFFISERVINKLERALCTSKMGWQFNFWVQVEDRQQLDKLVAKIDNIPEVLAVYRT